MGTRGKRGEVFKFTEPVMMEKLESHFGKSSVITWQHMHLFHWESDYLMKTTAGLWTEIEVKVSMDDYRRDFRDKGDKHAILAGEVNKPLKPNRFYYAVPETMAMDVLTVLPPYAGLISVPRFGNYVSVIRQAPMLTKEKWSDADLDLARKFYFLAKSYKTRYEGFSDEKTRLKAELDLVKAEFEAATGQKWKEYLKDSL